MGLRGVLLFGLLLSGGSLCAASQTLNISKTLTTGHQSNRTGQRLPHSYRLRVSQLRKPAVEPKTSHVVQNPTQRPEEVTLPQPELPMLVPGPNLNPLAEQQPKVVVVMPEQRTPVAANSVAVHCGEVEVTVEVNQNFLGNGQLIRPSDLTLGGCTALHVVNHALHFRVELQDCGSTLKMTDESLIYTFSLIYSPEPIGSTFVFKTNPAEVLIECHYPRKHYVSSDALMPTWMPFASSILEERHLHFSLRFMTEDWRSLRPSSVYFLSDVLHIEASVLQGFHVPLRVFVDRCVATATPNPNSEPIYPFISNHGCLTDAKLTGAKSYFMQRSQEDKLHFQLKAFRFHQDDRNSLFITCHLKATTLSTPIDSENKACSFLTEANRWVASGGDNKVCGCCESRCSQQRLKEARQQTLVILPGCSGRGRLLCAPS